MAADARDAIRERLGGKYEFLAALDERGSRVVYKVRDRARGTIGALKILTGEGPNAAALLARFRREADLARQLRTRNIARVHAFEELGADAACLEMELIEGPPLDQLLSPARQPEVGLAVEIARQALEALAALHRRRLVHLDVSPDNLILTADAGGEPLIMLLDLGVAAEVGEVPAGGYPGKPEYAPPERLEPPARPVEAADDLYSLAVVLYQLLTGRHPFPDRVGAVVPGGQGRRAPLDFSRADPAGRIPADLRSILRRALAEDPGQRFKSAIELSDALAQLGDLHPDPVAGLKEILESGDALETDEPAQPARAITPRLRPKTPTVVNPPRPTTPVVVAPPPPEPPPEPQTPEPEPRPEPPPEPPPSPEPEPISEPRPLSQPSKRWAWLWWTAGAAAAASALFFILRPGTEGAYTLRIDRAGAGSGTVTSEPAGIDCGRDCAEAFDPGTTVRLEAIADPGSIFDGWSGEPELVDSTATLTADLSYTAVFRPRPAYALTIVKTGTGTGRIQSSPAGIDCGVACTATFDSGSEVELIAVAEQGSVFAGWDPGISGNTVTVTGETTYTASFEPTPSRVFELTVRRDGEGSGTVTSSPAGINCGNQCRGQFGEGLPVRLIPAPAQGSVFTGWSPALADDSLRLAADRTVTATFARRVTHTLTVAKTGSGSGNVTSSPPGINCGNDCEATFAPGTVSLIAEPDSRSVFEGWSPALDDGQLRLSGDQTLTATFQPRPPDTFILTIANAGSGQGRIESDPPGIDCGDDCQENFSAGRRVELKATPDPGSVFEGWDPTLDNGRTTVSADQTFTATFALAPVETFTLTISLAGGGLGRVRSDPPGIDCGDDCQGSFAADTPVHLWADPEEESVFDGWSPSVTDDTVILTADRIQTARFELVPDDEPPTVSFRGQDYDKKKEDAVLIFEISDNKAVLEASASVRLGDTISTRAFRLREVEGEEGLYSLEIPADFHQGSELFCSVEAADSAGNVGSWGTSENLKRIERRRWFERFESRFQRAIDKVRGKN